MLFEMIRYSARNFAVNQTAKLNCGLLKMKLSSLAGSPNNLQKGSDTLNQTKLLFPLIFISLEDDSNIIIPTQPTSPGEIMSGGEGEPVEADVPAEDETVSPQGTHVTGTQTVTHEYLTLNGKVARETIKTNNTLTAVLDFIYDESGKPFALKYSTDGATFDTYYYVLNGVTGNVSPGVSDFTFTAMVSADSKGNVAFQWQPMGGGITTNASPSASITATTSVTFAPDVTDLEGPGKSIGGSLFTPYYGLGGGLDFNIAEGKDRNYYGITTSAGVGTRSGEFHANWGETYPITTRKFNIYEALYNRIERIREWCAQ